MMNRQRILYLRYSESALKACVFSLLIAAATLLVSCSSGRAIYNKGQYDEAVMRAIKSLRKQPSHKKARETLSLAYPQAVSRLEQDARNQMASDAPLKNRVALANYDRINKMYEAINTCPAALQVIPNPVSKYDQVSELKESAAEDVYKAGIQAMLKDSREEAKKAYYFFKDADNLVPGYKESAEMAAQAKNDATLFVLFRPEQWGGEGWNFESVVLNLPHKDFVQFLTPSLASVNPPERIDQVIQIARSDLDMGSATVEYYDRVFDDSVKVGQVQEGEKMKDVYKTTTSTARIYTKTIHITGYIQLVILDAKSESSLLNRRLTEDMVWSASWARCEDDVRALPDYVRRMCNRQESFTTRAQQARLIKRRLDRKLEYALTYFYKNY